MSPIEEFLQAAQRLTEWVSDESITPEERIKRSKAAREAADTQTTLGTRLHYHSVKALVETNGSVLATAKQLGVSRQRVYQILDNNKVDKP